MANDDDNNYVSNDTLEIVYSKFNLEDSAVEEDKTSEPIMPQEEDNVEGKQNS